MLLGGVRDSVCSVKVKSHTQRQAADIGQMCVRKYENLSVIICAYSAGGPIRVVRLSHSVHPILVGIPLNFKMICAFSLHFTATWSFLEKTVVWHVEMVM